MASACRNSGPECVPGGAVRTSATAARTRGDADPCPAITASRTIPGEFGARASKLLEYLDQRHHGVKLSDADFRRVVLWLDCNSEFLGAYEDAEAQALGELITPRLN